MTMESPSLFDSMCLHCRLAMVLTSSFNGNHWIVCMCVCMCCFRENFTSSYLNWLKTMRLIHFLIVPYVSQYLISLLRCYGTFPFPMVLYRHAPKFILVNSREFLLFHSVPPITWVKKQKETNLGHLMYTVEWLRFISETNFERRKETHDQ